MTDKFSFGNCLCLYLCHILLLYFLLLFCSFAIVYLYFTKDRKNPTHVVEEWRMSSSFSCSLWWALSSSRHNRSLSCSVSRVTRDSHNSLNKSTKLKLLNIIKGFLYCCRFLWVHVSVNFIFILRHFYLCRIRPVNETVNC